MTSTNDISKSICKSCEFRFRRVFMSSNIEELLVDTDNEDQETIEPGDNIVIMNMCLVANMDLDLDSTIECTHYKPITDRKSLSFFKHIM